MESCYVEDKSMLALNVKNKFFHKAVRKIRQNSETYLLKPCVLRIFYSNLALADLSETLFFCKLDIQIQKKSYNDISFFHLFSRQLC